jgi:5-methylcytosine-specific restriction protein A
MRKICSYSGCNAAVEVEHFDRSSPRCSLHPMQAKIKKVYAHHHVAGKNVYHTYKWKKLRKQKASINPICEHCLMYGIIVPLAVVDHVIELEDDGPIYDIDNLQSLCHACHNRKTNIERKKRENKSEFRSVRDF